MFVVQHMVSSHNSQERCPAGFPEREDAAALGYSEDAAEPATEATLPPSLETGTGLQTGNHLKTEHRLVRLGSDPRLSQNMKYQG